MTIVLKYTTEKGTQEQVEFEEDVPEIRFDHKERITDIDLSHLSLCTSLQTLDLEGNQLQSVDLAPLSSCNSLQVLNLSWTLLQNIDLGPLSSCTSLKRLDLRFNDLKTIDFTPLSSCTHLDDLRLNTNQLQNIDLTPLRHCSNLKILYISTNQLQTIDLAPLALCNNLKYLNLEHNQLQSIDLGSLSSCTKLEQLSLGRNQLKQIDLTPLSSCTKLDLLGLEGNHLQTIDLSPLSISIEQLWLFGNQLQQIDLTPLSSCSKLSELHLDSNYLQNIDLTPLSSCANLRELNLQGNQLQNINLIPLSSCSELSELFLDNIQNIDMTPLTTHGSLDASFSEDQKLSSWLRPGYSHWSMYVDVIYSPPSQLYPWLFLYKKVEQFKNDYRIQHDILVALDLSDYGFIDYDLKDMLLAIEPETASEDVRDILINNFVEKVTATVDAEGPTTGLNLDKLVANHDEIASRAQRILELRKREIEQVRIHIENNVVDLRELWLTAYGNPILHNMGMRLTTDLEGLEQISKALAELGFELKTGDTSISGVDMSDELKEAIWWIAENRGRPWSEIKEE